MEYLDLNLSLYGCLILLAVLIESIVQGLRKGQVKKLFGIIPPIALATVFSLALTMGFQLQFFNIMFAVMYAQIPVWLDSLLLGLVIARGTVWIHEQANKIGMNRNPDGSRIQS